MMTTPIVKLQIQSKIHRFMKTTFVLLITAFCCLPYYGQTQAQAYQPEDVLFTSGSYQLRYKHLLAYIDMEIEGEDPALLNDQAYIHELTKECLEEFAEAPAEMLSDLGQHYQAMQMGMGNLSNQQNSNTQAQQNQQSGGSYTTTEPTVQPNTVAGQWKQTLSGSVLANNSTHTSGSVFAQSGNYLHLCPNGSFAIYEYSAGGGDGIYAPNQVQLKGGGQWNVLEQNGGAYFQFTLQGATQALPISVVNKKIVIQGLGAFNYQQGAAQCY